MEDAPVTEIKRVKASELSYDKFFLAHLLPNVPVIVEGISSHFESAAQRFCRLDGSHRIPDFDALEAFGESDVPVANCNSRSGYEQPRVTQKLSEFLQYWRKVANSSIPHQSDTPKANNILYVKDWHFVKEYPSPPHAQLYRLPLIFGEDWINDWWDETAPDDDYRFVYMGPKDSWTPLHADVFRSYSWSYNVCGKKMWILFPPDQEPCITNRQNQYHFDVRVHADPKEFPDWGKATPIEVIQSEGDAIFVPSKWHHQVHNLEDTISINHNWGNACNLEYMLQYLLADYRTIVESISDIKNTFDSEEDFNKQVMLMLKVNSGMNLHDFHRFLRFHENRTQRELEDKDTSNERRNLLRFNLERIGKIEQELNTTVKFCIDSG